MQMYSRISKRRKHHPAATHRPEGFRETNLHESNLQFRVRSSMTESHKSHGKTYHEVAEDLFNTQLRRETQTLPKQVLYSYRTFRPRRELVRPLFTGRQN